MVQDYEFEANRKLKENFLRDWPIEKELQVNDPDQFYGFIYCIQNKNTGRRYIGSTFSTYVGTIKPRARAALLKRAGQYIYAYNKALKDTKSALASRRPIIRAMVEFGIDNFVMYPIAETTKKNHTELENYFIKKYDTIATGYNSELAGKTNNLGGRKQTTHDKLVRSMSIICVNMNQKKIIQSDSMKLFADYVGTSKDMIKNVNRHCLSYKGWFVFYTNKQKRDALAMYLVQDLPRIQKHSPEAKRFYLGLCDSIGQYLEDLETGNEYFPGFERLPDLVYTEEE